MLQGKDLKFNRILSIYQHLIEGRVLNKQQLALEFGVSEKSIQRDIEHLNIYLGEQTERADLMIKYSRKQGGYILENAEQYHLRREDIFAIIKVMLGTRAFNQKEMNDLINMLLRQMDQSNQKMIKELIGNELLNYVPLQHNEELLTKVWEFSEIIQRRQVIEMSYTREDFITIKRYLQPVGIIFSEYYFYLIAYMEELKPNALDYNHVKDDHLRIFRIDRFNDYKVINRNFYVPYSNRFEEGEFRKRIQFMYLGELLRVKFEFYGPRIEPVLDRLPTATIIEQDFNKFVVEAEVYGRGIDMWLRSQGSAVKVLSPSSLVDEMKKEAQRVLELYLE